MLSHSNSIEATLKYKPYLVIEEIEAVASIQEQSVTLANVLFDKCEQFSVPCSLFISVSMVSLARIYMLCSQIGFLKRGWCHITLPCCTLLVSVTVVFVLSLMNCGNCKIESEQAHCIRIAKRKFCYRRALNNKCPIASWTLRRTNSDAVVVAVHLQQL